MAGCKGYCGDRRTSRCASDAQGVPRVGSGRAPLRSAAGGATLAACPLTHELPAGGELEPRPPGRRLDMTPQPRRYQMFTPTLARKPLLVTGLATACLALGATASLAASPNAPFVGTFYDQSTFTDTVTGDLPCFPGVTATITATDTVSGHYNNAPDFFHFEGTDTLAYRVDFADGRYAIGGATTHFSEEANAETGTVPQIDTRASHERATASAARGSAVPAG